MANHKFLSFITLSLLSSSLLFGQMPDYSRLTEKEKRRFINQYGFLKLTSGDTLYAKIETLKDVNVPKIDKYGEIYLSYPKLLKRYTYKSKIPLDSVTKFFYGNPRRYRRVKKYNNRYIDLEDITTGKYNLYRRDFYILNAHSTKNYTLRSNNIRSDQPRVSEMLYIQGATNDSLYRLYGGAYTTGLILSEVLEGDMTEKQIKKLKGRNDRIIEAIKITNKEAASNQ